ncbi:MAG: hypothetical protein HYW48_00210 [Deltaproteobacteria bacterium]|nr:hypothetical protein [Deltaproteobacteria bacterium]
MMRLLIRNTGFVFAGLIFASFACAADDDLRTCTFGACMVPDDVGYCEMAIEKKVNKENLIDENENIGFRLKTGEMSKGKFQLAILLVEPDEIVKKVPPPILTFARMRPLVEGYLEGNTVVNKSAYLTEVKSDQFFSLQAQLNQAFLESIQHATKVDKYPSECSVDLVKHIKGAAGIADAFINFHQSLSIYSKGKWAGAYTLSADEMTTVYALVADQIALYGRPKSVFFFDIVGKTMDEHMRGGKTVVFFFDVRDATGKTKNLVVSFNVVTMNMNWIVRKVMKIFRSRVYANIKREVGMFVDGLRVEGNAD